MKKKVPNITNISFAYIEGMLIMALQNAAVSSGQQHLSKFEPSYVVEHLRPDELAHSSIRFSFGRFTTEEEVRSVAENKKVVAQLRELSHYEMFKDK